MVHIIGKGKGGKKFAETDQDYVEAKNGYICITDKKTGAFTQVSYADAVTRVAALREMCGNSQQSGLTMHPKDRFKYIRFCDDMRDVLAEAKEQGGENQLSRDTINHRLRKKKKNFVFDSNLILPPAKS